MQPVIASYPLSDWIVGHVYYIPWDLRKLIVSMMPCILYCHQTRLQCAPRSFESYQTCFPADNKARQRLYTNRIDAGGSQCILWSSSPPHGLPNSRHPKTDFDSKRSFVVMAWEQFVDSRGSTSRNRLVAARLPSHRHHRHRRKITHSSIFFDNDNINGPY